MTPRPLAESERARQNIERIQLLEIIYEFLDKIEDVGIEHISTIRSALEAALKEEQK